MKAAVYAGTKNLYSNMIHAAKSLLMYSDVDKIYFLIEDDIFPYELPSVIETINISNQTYFRPDGPNYNPQYNLGLSYMVLIRVALSKIFPNLDKILSLDVDTLVRDNISDLWDLDISDYYLAASTEKKLSEELGYPYINMGVALINLKKMRDDHMDDKIIESLNTYYYIYNEQSCINELCQNKILILPSDYNSCWQAERPAHEKIMHFAGIHDWFKWPIFHIYDNLEFNQIIRNQFLNPKIDIIIPTYKDKIGLQNTLDSIGQENLEDINITIINDCDGDNYDDILEKYNYINNYFYLENNVGPGMVRQYGLDHTNNPYLLFIDTGDLFVNDGLKKIVNYIKNNIFYDVYSWNYYDRFDNKLIEKHDNMTIGFVYRRDFLKAHQIVFCKTGSYANEDYGFNQGCRFILNYQKSRNINRLYTGKEALFKITYNSNSLTEKNNREFFYNKIIHGMAINGIHGIQIALKNSIPINYILFECANLMAEQYFYFIRTYQERPELLEENWKSAKFFYDNCYKIYHKVINDQLLNYMQKRTIKCLTQIHWTRSLYVNFRRFLLELERNEIIPKKYLEK